MFICFEKPHLILSTKEKVINVFTLKTTGNMFPGDCIKNSVSEGLMATS